MGMMEALRLRCAVVSVRGQRGVVRDSAAELLAARAAAAGHTVVRREIIVDEVDDARRVLSDCIADPEIQLVLSNGGSGFARRNTVPEAAAGLLEQEIRGFGNLLHQLFFTEVGTSLVQQRALAGYANNTLIFCLPGATGACALAWDLIIKPQLAMPMRG